MIRNPHRWIALLPLLSAAAHASCTPVAAQVDLGTYTALSDTRVNLTLRVQCDRQDDRFQVRLGLLDHLILQAAGGAAVRARVLPTPDWTGVRAGSQVVKVPLLLPAGQWSAAGVYAASLEVAIVNDIDRAQP